MSKRSDATGRGAGGEGHKIDSAELPHVPGASQKITGSDPYNSASLPIVPAHGHKRRALDDMRQLSTHNKAAAAGERPAVKPTSDLALRLAGMRVQLERVLSDMEAVRAPDVDTADRKAVGLILQLRLAARHLEDAIDSLLPHDEP